MGMAIWTWSILRIGTVAYAVFFGVTRLNFTDRATQTLTGGAHFILQLQIHPKLFGHVEKTSQPDCGICSDAAAFQYDIVDARSGDVKTPSQLVSGEIHWFKKFFTKNLTGMNLPTGGCIAFLSHRTFLGNHNLMIIGDLDVKSFAVFPCKTN